MSLCLATNRISVRNAVAYDGIVVHIGNDATCDTTIVIATDGTTLDEAVADDTNATHTSGYSSHTCMSLTGDRHAFYAETIHSAGDHAKDTAKDGSVDSGSADGMTATVVVTLESVVILRASYRRPRCVVHVDVCRLEEVYATAVLAAVAEGRHLL